MGRKDHAAPRSERLYLLAFDHRNSFRSQFFGFPTNVRAEDQQRLVDAKRIIYEGCLSAIASGLPASNVGILVDEQFGAEVALDARAKDLKLAMPVERSGQREFAFEYGRAFGVHLETYRPTYAKVLVRFNPALEGELNDRQVRRLKLLTAWLEKSHSKLMFELLVPPLAAQLAAVGGDQKRFDEETRPGLMLEAIQRMHRDGIEPAVWKIEGFESADACQRIASAVRSEGRDEVGCVVLGRGADSAAVERWLAAAASVPGYIGFAVGRTIWWDPLKAFTEGRASRPEAVTSIADNYLSMVRFYEAVE